jgi:hypothetical protein
LRPAPAAAARTLLDRVETRPVGGRELVRRDDEWREVATLGAATDRVVEPGSAEAADLLARHPWLAELAGDGRTVVFRDDGGEVVALRPEAGGPPGGEAPEAPEGGELPGGAVRGGE